VIAQPKPARRVYGGIKLGCCVCCHVCPEQSNFMIRCLSLQTKSVYQPLEGPQYWKM